MLVPDDVVEEVVKQRLEQHDWNYGFILDGFPRNARQAAFFLESYDIDAVLLIEVPDAVVRERILNRRLCPKCGLDYNLIFHRPAVPNTCDICGAVLIARPDDTPEAVLARLQDYHTKTQPILELFRRKELVVIVDGTRSVAEVQQDLRRQLVRNRNGVLASDASVRTAQHSDDGGSGSNITAEPLPTHWK